MLQSLKNVQNQIEVITAAVDSIQSCNCYTVELHRLTAELLDAIEKTSIQAHNFIHWIEETLQSLNAACVWLAGGIFLPMLKSTTR